MAAIRKYHRQMLEAAAAKGFWLKVLGQVQGPNRKYEMWLVRTREIYPFDHKDPRVLIVAGFHGEEVAGPWGVLQWLKRCDPKLLKSIDISIIPIINPYGFARKKRYGLSDMPTNIGFYHESGKPSPEGQILIDNIDLLRPLAQDGFLSLHEDNTIKEYYLYTFEHGDSGKFTRGMRRELAKHFRKSYTGTAYVDTTAPNVGPMCQDGLIYKFCDGSFEDWLFHLGVPKIAVTETPGRYRLQRRVTANEALIQKFVELILEGD